MILLISLPTKFFISPKIKRKEKKNVKDIFSGRIKLWNQLPVLKRTCNEVIPTIPNEYNVDFFDFDARLIKKFKSIDFNDPSIDIDLPHKYDYIFLSLRIEPGNGNNEIFDLQIEFTLKVLKYLKDRFPNAKYIAGGSQFSNNKEALKHHFDYIHKGYVTPQLMKQILDGDYPHSDIYPYSYSTSNISTPINSTDFEFSYKDVIRFYNIGLQPKDKNIKVAEISFISGCPGECGFCVSANQKVRFFNFKDIILSYLDKGFNAFIFMNDCINPIAKKLCNWIVQNNLKFYWTDSSRHCLDSDYYSMLYEAGCRSLHFGMETVDNEILKYINKGFTIEQIEESIRLSHNAGIWNITSWIVGLPHSKKDHHIAIYKYILDNRNIIQSASIFKYHRYPNTPLYDNPEEEFDLSYRPQELIDSGVLNYIPTTLLFLLYDYYNKKDVMKHLQQNQ